MLVKLFGLLIPYRVKVVQFPKHRTLGRRGQRRNKQLLGEEIPEGRASPSVKNNYQYDRPRSGDGLLRHGRASVEGVEGARGGLPSEWLALPLSQVEVPTDESADAMLSRLLLKWRRSPLRARGRAWRPIHECFVSLGARSVKRNLGVPRGHLPLAERIREVGYRAPPSPYSSVTQIRPSWGWRGRATPTKPTRLCDA